MTSLDNGLFCVTLYR